MVLDVRISKAPPAWKAEPFDFGPPAAAALPFAMYDPSTVNIGKYLWWAVAAVAAVVVVRRMAR